MESSILIQRKLIKVSGVKPDIRKRGGFVVFGIVALVLRVYEFGSEASKVALKAALCVCSYS